MAQDFSKIGKDELKRELERNPRKRAMLAAYKDRLDVLTPEQLEIAIGVMLGDVSLQSQNQGKTYRMKFEQGATHVEYIEHLHSKFSEWCLTKPTPHLRTNANGNVVTNWTFQTISHSAFVSLADIFFHEKNSKNKYRKTITQNFVEKHLTPTAMAYWFMDDGGRMDYSENQGKGIVFNCHGFPTEEVDILVKGLESRYNLECWKKQNKGKSVVAISGKSYSQMKALIEELIIPSLRSKFPTPRRERKKKE